MELRTSAWHTKAELSATEQNRVNNKTEDGVCFDIKAFTMRTTVNGLKSSEGKKLALDHFVFAASRENYSEIAANCGVIPASS